jgi:putative nucleotidyltransferase with HDIG domain
MNRKSEAFFAAVILAAFGLAYQLPAEPLFFLSVKHAFGITFFVAVALLAEFMAIEFGAAKSARSSLAFLPFLAVTLIFAPIIAVVGTIAVSGFSTIVLSRQSPFKALFNVSQAVLSVALAGLAYELFLDPATVDQSVRLSVDYIGFGALAIVFFSVNVGLASTAIALLREQPVFLTLRNVVGPRGGNLVYDLMASPIAVVPAILYFEHYITGIVIILLPLMLMRFSYQSKLQLEEANRDLLKVLVKAIETRDPYTSGHSVRVSTLSRAIAEDLGLPRRRLDVVETAALLHDIGKIDSVYEAVIRKPHDLTEVERTLINTHATKGADLLESLSSVSAEIIRSVRHHHERFDGTGYPSGLLAEEIPIGARIIMLSDAVDAMLSDRPYRRALPLAKVRSELIRCSGDQFDPSIVRAVLANNTLERAAALIDRSQAPALQLVTMTESA